MTHIMVNNIPSNFIESSFKQLLVNLELSPFESWSMRKTLNNSKYVILQFDSAIAAKDAIIRFNEATITIQSQEFRFQAELFLPNFRNFIQNSQNQNIMVHNLPPDIQYSDVLNIFEKFGPIITARMLPFTPASKSKSFFILYQRADDAQSALTQAQGKFLGAYQIYVARFQTPEQRIEQNKQLIFRSLPKLPQTEASFKKMLQEAKVSNLIDWSIPISTMDDNRPITISSNGGQVICTAIDGDSARKIVQLFKENPKQFEDVKEPVSADLKLTKSLRKFQQSQRQLQFAGTERNIKVFNVRPDADAEKVRAFFEKFGQIESISAPRIYFEKCYWFILYKNDDGAQMAILQACTMERNEFPRIANLGCNLIVELDKPKDRSKLYQGRARVEEV